MPLDACVVLQFLTEWNLSHDLSHLVKTITNRGLDPIVLIRNPCLLQSALAFTEYHWKA